ncbi:MAG TPA: hypothetical protein VFS43_45565 [Polyangiaceae bacterium]|nr:hypothetical protein [Polyangiaceae bacterium]
MSKPTAPLLLPLAAALAALAGGCRREPKDDDPPCPPPQPAFALTVRASDGRPLPADTTLVVSSGWGEESFAMSAPPPSPKAVFCQIASAQLACTLWTHGAALVDVTSAGLAPARVELRADADECGVITRAEELILYPAPAEGEAPLAAGGPPPMSELPLPDFYDPRRVGTLYPPDAAAAAAAASRAGLGPAEGDRRKVALFLVDAQVDFIHPPPVGSLAVPGAVDDTRRTVEFLYRHAGRIGTVVASLDSHVPHQIFYASWWRDEAGRPPAPFTLIHAADVEAGRFRPLREPAWSLAYVRGLAATAKKALCIWPYHTMVGSPGQALDPALFEAVTYHAVARGAEPRFVTKGSVPQTEHYSVFEPEIAYGAAAEARRNDALLDELARHDLVLVAGQAKSHCVLESVRSLLGYLERRPGPRAEVCLLADCTSSVAHPEIDFEAIARAEYDALVARGLRLAASTEAPALLG